MWTATGVEEGCENHGSWDLLSSSVSRLSLLGNPFHHGPLCADVILRASLYLNIYRLPKGIIAQPLLPGALCLAQASFQG